MAEEKTEDKPKKAIERDSCILVGSKNVMSYVLACVTLFSKGAIEVVIKARGRLISRAVDVSEVAAKRFLENQVAVKDIKINSEEFENKEGKQVRVSTIEITLEKTKLN